MTVRAVFFDEDDAREAGLRLVADGFAAEVVRERLAGEDDDEDHPWAVLTDAPEILVELLVERYDGWLDTDPGASATGPQPLLPPLDLPLAPRTGNRSDNRRGRG